MSQYFRLGRSKYLHETTKILKNLRLQEMQKEQLRPVEQRNLSILDLYACSPLDCDELHDNRSSAELLRTIDIDKLTTQLRNIPVGTETWVIICCGSFAPIHKSHIQMGQNAVRMLELTGHKVAMAYFIPNNPTYTAAKIRKRGDEVPKYLEAKHIEGSLKATFAHESKLDACFLDLRRMNYCEWFVCASELVNMLGDNFPAVNFKFAVVGGEDLVRSPSQLWKGTSVVDFVDMVMMAPRGMPEEKRIKFPLPDDVIVLPEEDITLSSTKIRQYLKEGNIAALQKDLDANTLAYIRQII